MSTWQKRVLAMPSAIAALEVVRHALHITRHDAEVGTLGFIVGITAMTAVVLYALHHEDDNDKEHQ